MKWMDASSQAGMPVPPLIINEMVMSEQIKEYGWMQ